MGWIALATSVGTLVGPLAGGLVYAHAGYYSVFAVACGFILVDIVLRIVMIEKKELRKWSLIVNAESLDSTTPLLSSDYTSRNATILGESVSIESDDSKEALPRGSMGIITILTTPRLLAILSGGFVYACIITCPQSVSCLEQVMFSILIKLNLIYRAAFTIVCQQSFWLDITGGRIDFRPNRRSHAIESAHGYLSSPIQ
jgi:MFS family permease